jgi:hypothetical protein
MNKDITIYIISIHANNAVELRSSVERCFQIFKDRFNLDIEQNQVKDLAAINQRPLSDRLAKRAKKKTEKAKWPIITIGEFTCVFCHHLFFFTLFLILIGL